MVRRCIAPNCTSGYDTNKERCHFFNVPRNSVSMWQKAIPRENFIVKPGQVLCEKHFRKEDILWNRQHFDASGNIVGWSEYKIPRLKKGAIPTLFGGHPCPAPTISAAVTVGNIAAAHEYFPCDEPNEESKPAATSAEVITSSVEIIDPLKLIFPPLECAFSFDAIFNDDTAIDLPLSWSRRNITSSLHLQAVQFSQWTCRREGKHIKTICLKEIVIGKSLIVDLYAMGHSMELEKFNIPAEPLSCASDLAKIVKIIDELKVCSGCVFPGDNLDVETASTYKDNTGQVRHKNCPLLLNLVKTCIHCERGRSTLQRKRRRLESAANMQRIRVELSPSRKRKLEVLRRKVDNIGRSRRRALAAVNCLRASLQKCKKKVSQLSQKTIENLLEVEGIRHDDWDFEDVAIEHSYKTHLSICHCDSGFKFANVNANTHGRLLHPNLKAIERSFSNNCNSPDVFHLTSEDLLVQDVLSLPCFQHAENIFIWHMSLDTSTSMRQYSRKQQADAKKDNRELAKFTKH